MKEIYRKENWGLGIYDDKNYVLFDVTKPITDKKTGGISYKYDYFSQMHLAIRELSRRLANETCTDLKSWVECLVGYYSSLEEALTVLR